jgi:hypothetical protein
MQLVAIKQNESLTKCIVHSTLRDATTPYTRHYALSRNEKLQTTEIMYL